MNYHMLENIEDVLSKIKCHEADQITDGDIELMVESVRYFRNQETQKKLKEIYEESHEMVHDH